MHLFKGLDLIVLMYLGNGSFGEKKRKKPLHFFMCNIVREVDGLAAWVWELCQFG